MTPECRLARGIQPDRQPDAGWSAAVEAAYARFTDHWAAEVAYHL